MLGGGVDAATLVAALGAGPPPPECRWGRCPHRGAKFTVKRDPKSPIPSNLLKGFQRCEFVRNFCAGVSTYLGQELGLLRVTSLHGVYLKHSPSNPPKGFQRCEFVRNFCAGVSTFLGQGLGLLRVTSLPGVHPNPPCGPILESETSLWFYSGFDGHACCSFRRCSTVVGCILPRKENSPIF